MAVDEALEFVDVHSQSDQDLAGFVVGLPHHPEEQVVRADAVASGAHGLLPGIADYPVEFVRYLYFHNQS